MTTPRKIGGDPVVAFASLDESQRASWQGIGYSFVVRPDVDHELRRRELAAGLEHGDLDERMQRLVELGQLEAVAHDPPAALAIVDLGNAVRLVELDEAGVVIDDWILTTLEEAQATPPLPEGLNWEQPAKG